MLLPQFKNIMKPIKTIEIEQLDENDDTKSKITVSFEDGDFLILYDTDREELNRLWRAAAAQAARSNSVVRNKSRS